jgi:thioredoxin 1
MSDLVVRIGDEREFERQVVQAGGLVAADFAADWCGDCRRLAPTFEKLAEEFAGKVRFVTVDIQAAPGLEAAWKIGLIPTVLLMDKGQVVHRWINEQSIVAYRQVLAERTKQ